MASAYGISPLEQLVELRLAALRLYRIETMESGDRRELEIMLLVEQKQTIALSTAREC